LQPGLCRGSLNMRRTTHLSLVALVNQSTMVNRGVWWPWWLMEGAGRLGLFTTACAGCGCELRLQPFNAWYAVGGSGCGVLVGGQGLARSAFVAHAPATLTW
jgi:hypothetical protein